MYSILINQKGALTTPLITDSPLPLPLKQGVSQFSSLD
jgi:hypothetical protein